VLPFSDSDDPPLPFDDPTQQRYELIRPVVVIGNRTATERAQETGMHPETVGRLKRRFEQGCDRSIPAPLCRQWLLLSGVGRVDTSDRKRF
jgi:hypothetical protein